MQDPTSLRHGELSQRDRVDNGGQGWEQERAWGCYLRTTELVWDDEKALEMDSDGCTRCESPTDTEVCKEKC